MKKLLPPQLFVVFIILMGLICWGFGFRHNISYPYNLIGLPLIFSGLALAQLSKNLFRKSGTNVNTFDQPDILITTRFFKYTRNPMYLGFVIALSGTAILYQAAYSSIILAVIFSIIVDRWYISLEEKMLLSRFGDDYLLYCRKTRRWI